MCKLGKKGKKEKKNKKNKQRTHRKLLDKTKNDIEKHSF